MNSILKHVIGFYSSLFDDSTPSGPVNVSQIIPIFVDDNENVSLITIPSFYKIRNVVKGMDGSSAPGPDGFTASQVISLSIAGR